jgi:hypothetical protein
VETFADLLTSHVIKLQQEQNRIIKQKELVDLLGVGETTLNLAWNGKRPPSKTLVEKCARYFSDLRFYDAAGMSRPDPLLHYTTKHWGEVPENIRKKIAEEVALYTNEKAPVDE